MSQSGGVAGLSPKVRETLAAEGSPAHDAAIRLAGAAERAASPRRPDAFSYRVEIVAGDEQLLRATFRDPVPPEVAELLDALG